MKCKSRAKGNGYSCDGFFAKLLNENSSEVWIEPPFYFCYGRHITLGEGTYVNFNCNFVDDGLITVGRNVMFGPSGESLKISIIIQAKSRLKVILWI